MIDKINELEKEMLENLENIGEKEKRFMSLRLGMIQSMLQMNLQSKEGLHVRR